MKPSPIRVARRFVATVPSPPKDQVWKRQHRSRAEWEAEWLKREKTGRDNPKWQSIARGFALPRKIPVKLARQILDGRASGDQILSLVEGTGTWWYLVGHEGYGVNDTEEFAISGSGEEITEEHFGRLFEKPWEFWEGIEDGPTRGVTISQMLWDQVGEDLEAYRAKAKWYKEKARAEYEGPTVYDAEIPIVLVAERPVAWHPEDNPSQGGLMGNSYIDHNIWKHVVVTEIRYDNGKKWIRKRVNKRKPL
jgi:hypothetical protein